MGRVWGKLLCGATHDVRLECMGHVREMCWALPPGISSGMVAQTKYVWRDAS